MLPFRKTAVAAVLGAGLLALSPTLSAQGSESQNEALMRLIQQQNAQIEALKQRLEALETQRSATAPSATETDSAVAATSGDEESDLLDELQSQLAESGAAANAPNWRRGAPQFRSADGFFSFRPRGRVVADWSSTDGSAYDARNISGTEMRAMRLGAEGNFGSFGYKLDVDFADQATSVKDAWISYEWRMLGLPTELYVGNKLKDRGIDASGTLARNPFMERNAVASIGAPVNSYYGVGTFLKVFGPSWHLGLSVSGDDLDNAGAESDSIAYGIRGHWNPLKWGQGFVHLGSWYFYEELGDEVVSINNVPRIAQNFNDNLRVSASSIANPTKNESFGFELGGVYRSFWAFAEYGERRIGVRDADRIDRDAHAVSAGWMITGEKPGFSTRSGLWAGTRVLRPFGRGAGWGAFEVVARYDVFDFREAERGGFGERGTYGLNWYLNDWTRLTLNYVDWTTNNKVGNFQGPDSGQSIGVRAQVVF